MRLFGRGVVLITVIDHCARQVFQGGEGWREGGGSVCRSAGQLTFLCSATIRCRVQSRITSLHERLALSRIKEESARVGRAEMSSQHRGRNRGACSGECGYREEGFNASGAGGEGSDLL